MKADIVPVGNPKGIRIPKALLDQCGFDNEAEIDVEDGRLVISPCVELRKGWEEAFAKAAARGNDGLIDTPAPEFDGRE